MIDFQNFVLDNGLKVYVHQDITLPTATVNLLYNVGSRDEDENKTGFAHLFEHLMFGGSVNIPSYDEPLQLVGGENNAFTSPDITNYYISLPSDNLETAFWLESDRMLSLSFDPKVLEVQRKVVIEEYKQQYLNQPYGDAYMKLKALAYKVHPYRWPTIGRDIKHIEDASMDDVKSFFHKFYVPNNAILVVSGNVVFDDVRRLAEKWFGPIPSGEQYLRNLPQEPVQKESRVEHVEADVPLDAIYKAFHIPERLHDDYYTADLLSDVLGRGKSSRLHQELVNKRRLFSNISAYISGSMDPGTLNIHGKLNKGVKMEEAEAGIQEVIRSVIEEPLEEEELEKVKNQAESTIVFSEMELLNRSMNLAYAAMLGNPDLINEESRLIQKVEAEGIRKLAANRLVASNESTLYYHSRTK
ncbi:pitrilysin family protein [Porifericola rhodea]|uniref:M16 family metallopeptidase n=1 Tax=Porifericola rhodea TaxID=930972 RepID=UPI0026667173|nr:pitrilysin family protein [Porifericola rhodea]WKN29966.1 pitrilysin family protein [Porifericola rhodea]